MKLTTQQGLGMADRTWEPIPDDRVNNNNRQVDLGTGTLTAPGIGTLTAPGIGTLHLEQAR